jgi:hypothetical protein
MRLTAVELAVLAAAMVTVTGADVEPAKVLSPL